jgi:hypothetical protein
VIIKIPELICEICGSKKDVPICCDKSMMVKDGYLLCCCSKECGYQSIPECCGTKMTYLD